MDKLSVCVRDCSVPQHAMKWVRAFSFLFPVLNCFWNAEKGLYLPIVL